MPSRVLLLHGPNLNLLFDLQKLDAELEERAQKLGIDLKTFQANSEGALVDALHAERTRVSGVIVNAAKLAPHAEVLAEAISLVKRPTVEVITDSSSPRSALEGVVLEQVKGKDAYGAALDVIAAEIKANQNRPTSAAVPVTPDVTFTDDDNTGEMPKEEAVEVVKKTLGKKQPAEAPTGPSSSTPRKTIGRGEAKPKAPAEVGLTRAVLRDKIAERLSGKLTPAGLATWARSQWQLMQRGAPVESGQRDRLEDVLQTLLLTASSKANDHQLIELMTQLG